MQVSIIDLKRQYNNYKKEIDEAIAKVLQKCNFILGDEVKDFEARFAQYCGSKYAVGLASGTDALILALKAMDIGPGDEVITTTNSYIATAVAVSLVGAKPIFIDIDPVNYCIDVSKIEKAVTKKTKAIIPVHIYGHPADMDKINEIAKKHKFKVIEDACQAHGAEYKGKRTGSLGDIACFSFYPSKNLGAYGDGGMVTTNDQELYEKVKVLRDCGRRSKYDHMLIAGNSRLDTIQAAVLGVKLKYLDEWTSLRRKHADFYASLLKDAGSALVYPRQDKWAKHVYHVYAVQVKDRNKVIEFLSKAGVGTLIHYPIPIHLQEAYSGLGYKRGSLPVAEGLCDNVLSLPMFPELEDSEIKYVADKLKEAICV